MFEFYVYSYLNSSKSSSTSLENLFSLSTSATTTQGIKIKASTVWLSYLELFKIHLLEGFSIRSNKMRDFSESLEPEYKRLKMYILLKS
jgi:hypothetical protein